MSALGLSQSELSLLLEATRAEVTERVKVLRRDPTLPMLTGKDVVVVDDGLATGGDNVGGAEINRGAKAEHHRRWRFPVAAAPSFAAAFIPRDASR